MLERRVLRGLQQQVDAPHVYTRPADLAAYAYDAWGASGERHLPDAVVFPASTDEAAGVVAVCAYHRVAVIPRGAGTGYAAGAAPVGGGVVLSLARMNHVLGIEPDAQRIHVEAGTVTQVIHERTARAGLYYPPDPGSASTGTIGGNVACNAAGPHTLRYGTTTDYVAGLTAVFSDGRVARLGEGGDGTGRELLAALCGSEGTLAVITEVLLRLLPAPAARVTLAATFEGMQSASGAVAEIAAQGVVPAALEFLDESALDAVRRAGGRVLKVHAGAWLLVELEGAQPDVDHQLEVVRTALATAGATSVDLAADAADVRRLWNTRKAVSAAVAKVMIGKVNEDVVVPRDRISELLERTRALGAAHELPVVNFGHLGDGNVHATFMIDPRLPGERERADAAAADLFEAVLGMDGSLSGEHGVGAAKLAFVERQLGAGGVELERRLKRTLDPIGVLNPGKKFPAPQPVSATASSEAA